MTDFLLLFRNDYNAVPESSPEEMQAVMKQWMDWMGGIAARNQLADRGNRLGSEGRVVKPGQVVTDGPYTEIKELLGGYIVIKANSFDEAAEIAKGCPILASGGNVEVRDIVPVPM